eukprot:TRINITY_DN3053_c0_g1_i8.p1 TRINITY_DN3053_c0_g1~~TRINITY_DN3053_c0_g1_i8.p1  ORF type:complete len:246 (+),score=65.61 TRINITY_DN3053_c0_g1_i8:3-740(+)
MVFMARWGTQVVAVKQLNVGKSDQDSKIAFFSEFDIMRKMEPHPNVLQFCGIIQDPLMIVTEYCENGNLSEYLESNAAIDLKKKILILKSIAAGMNHLSQQRIVHGDLAARNCLLKEGFETVVADFGMSQMQNESQKFGKTRNEQGLPLKWLAPEAFKSKFSQKTDVYSFGVVCIEVLTRKTPYPEYSLKEFAADVTTKDLISTLPSYIPENTPAALSALIKECLSKDPTIRPTFEQIVNRMKKI